MLPLYKFWGRGMCVMMHRAFLEAKVSLTRSACNEVTYELGLWRVWTDPW